MLQILVGHNEGVGSSDLGRTCNEGVGRSGLKLMLQILVGHNEGVGSSDLGRTCNEGVGRSGLKLMVQILVGHTMKVLKGQGHVVHVYHILESFFVEMARFTHIDNLLMTFIICL